MATVVYASAILYPAGDGRVVFTTLPVPVETAHDVANDPVVKVYASPWRVVGAAAVVEDSWHIDVLALVDAEAEDLMDQARGGLLADIAVGRIEKGTHGDKQGQVLGSSDRREQVLAAYWRAELISIAERVRRYRPASRSPRAVRPRRSTPVGMPAGCSAKTM